MIRLNYLKDYKNFSILEAFDSNKISKTLKFIKSGYKDHFIKRLTTIIQKLDAPLSSLNDEDFTYLPLKKSITFGIDSIRKEDCNNCEEGKVKIIKNRKRSIVDCEICKGSGVVDGDDQDIDLYKFWFNKEGDMIGESTFDGKYHPDVNAIELYDDKIDITSDVLNLSQQDLKKKYKLINGKHTLIISNFKTNESNRSTNVIGKNFTDVNKRLYIISNKFNGNSYSNNQISGNKWRSYGSYNTDVLANLKKDYNSESKVFLVKSINIDNVYYNIFNSGNRLDILNESDFAIIFNVSSFINRGFEKVSSKRNIRFDNKVGSTALMSNDDIKTQNLDRYLTKLSNIDLSNGIKEIIRKLPKLFGNSELSLFYTYTNRNNSTFDIIISDFYRFIKSEDYIKDEINIDLSERMRRSLSQNVDMDNKINSRLDDFKSEIYTDANIDRNKMIIYDSIMELSYEINNVIISSKYDSIESLEILRYKLSTISSILTDKLTYDSKRILNIITSYYGGNLEDYLRGLELDKIIESFRKSIKLINLI